jgi:hypothetical protein
MFFWVMGFWAVGVIVSFINGNRRLPLVILLLGIGVVAATFKGLLGYYGIAALAILRCPLRGQWWLTFIVRRKKGEVYD